MVIHACESQIFIGLRPERLPQPIASRGHIHFAARNLFEQILELFV